MYTIFGLFFGLLGVGATYVLFKNPTNEHNEVNLSLFVIVTILFYLVAIVSFGIESICDRLDDIKNKEEGK